LHSDIKLYGRCEWQVSVTGGMEGEKEEAPKHMETWEEDKYGGQCLGRGKVQNCQFLMHCPKSKENMESTLNSGIRLPHTNFSTCNWDHKPPCIQTKIFVEIFVEFDGLESNILDVRHPNC